jgi:hypothetical protein
VGNARLGCWETLFAPVPRPGAALLPAGGSEREARSDYCV